MAKTRTARPTVFFAAAMALVAGGFGLTVTLLPVPTDAAVGPAQAGGLANTEQCAIRLTTVERGFRVSLSGLSAAAQASVAERCDAYQTHLTALSVAHDVYSVCMTGFARDDQVGQIKLALGDWSSTINSSCGK